MSIANLDTSISNCRAPFLLNGERWIVPRCAIYPSPSQLARQARTDDGRGRRAHEDKLIGRIASEAVKNVFDAHLDVKDFRATVDYFETGRALEIGDLLPAKEVLARIERAPMLRKKADELSKAFLPDPPDADARDAASASAAEFILEGLHVHNKLNKTPKAGGASYRR
jgi:magnesium chelatase subunit I